MYDTIPTGKGKPAVTANVQYYATLIGTGISYREVQEIFASVDCPSPSESAISKGIKMVVPGLIKAGAKHFEANQDLLMSFIKHSDYPGATVMMDTANGRAMSQRGTQCSTPVVGCNTSKQLTVGMETQSQVCASVPPGKLVCHTYKGCTATYQQGGSISNAEEKNCVAATEILDKKGIKVKCLLTDDTHQIIRKLNDNGSEKLFVFYTAPEE